MKSLQVFEKNGLQIVLLSEKKRYRFERLVPDQPPEFLEGGPIPCLLGPANIDTLAGFIKSYTADHGPELVNMLTGKK